MKVLQSMLGGLCLLAIGAAAQAAALPKLQAFIAQTQSLSAQFNQVSSGGKAKTQTTMGYFSVQRPGKFRWVYNQPMPQLIVGDSRFIWIYDEELEQVTKRKLDQALGDTPAAILAGDNQFTTRFHFKELGMKGAQEWLEATPKNPDSGFQKLRFAFVGADLNVMELEDSFGRTTKIQFKDLKRNPKLDAKQFEFTPPKGADVIDG